MNDTRTDKPVDADQAPPRDAVSDDASSTTDEALDVVERIEQSTDQLVDETLTPEDSADDLDYLLAEVEALGAPGGVEAEPEPSASPDDSHAASASLQRQSDADGEALFDSEFDPVEAVLDEVFETKATLVQRGASSPVKIRDSSRAEKQDDAPVEIDNESEFEDAASLSQQQSTAPPANQSADERAVIEWGAGESADGQPRERQASTAVDIPESATTTREERAAEAPTRRAPAESERSEVAVPAAGDAAGETSDAVPVQPVSPQSPSSRGSVEPADSDVDESSAPELTDVWEAETEDGVEPGAQAEPVDAAAEPVAEPEAPSTDVEVTEDAERWLQRIAEAVAPPAKRTLIVINAPLRKVPPSMRPLVDYLALTLIMWVPIVWAIVWLVQR